ncbi:BRCT domain-containing protein [Candidatus Laterigemmans baculatus]|uniref:BRCT domain-containing protein n=1 Tax=Candidatus Laterigemmans baculatus TaxID=2770505 RepID=UPI0013DC87F6|nr:BRCT domain-containing protein [Candidatus Laterigemmans baculatus]
MTGSFSKAALDGQVFFLEGRYQPEKKKKVAEIIRDNGGKLATKFSPDVTVVLQEKLGKSTASNIETMPALTAFCEMFVARDNVKFDFVATTADGRPVDVHLSKLRYWEFSASGESVAFQTELDGLDDRSPGSVARVLARLFRETGIASVASKGMKVKMTLLSTNTPKIPAADFKKLALAAFEELTGTRPTEAAGHRRT